MVRALRERLAGSFSAGLFGEPVEVADVLAELAALGFTRLTLAAVTPSSYRVLAGELARVRHEAAAPG